jgi:hypothetical protein
MKPVFSEIFNISFVTNVCDISTYYINLCYYLSEIAICSEIIPVGCIAGWYDNFYDRWLI